MRLVSDAELRRRYAPVANDWPRGTLGHQRTEAGNAFRELGYLLLRDYLRLLRRLPFVR